MDRADAPCAGAALLASSSFTMTAASFFFSYAYRTSGARAGGV